MKASIKSIVSMLARTSMHGGRAVRWLRIKIRWRQFAKIVKAGPLIWRGLKVGHIVLRTVVFIGAVGGREMRLGVNQDVCAADEIVVPSLRRKNFIEKRKRLGIERINARFTRINSKTTPCAESRRSSRLDRD